MSSSKPALDAWKRADADARIVEARLLAVWELHEKGLVGAPDEALLHDVFRLRSVANERLMGAIAALSTPPNHPPASRPAGNETPASVRRSDTV